MADELGQVAAETTPGTGAAVAGGAAESAAAASASAAIPAVASATPAAVATAEPAYLSVRDALRNYGYQLPEHLGDDHAALQHLIGQLQGAQQSERLARYGQEYLQHQPAFMQWYRQQQEAQQQAQAQKAKWFSPPEYNPEWLSQVRRDEQGNLVPGPGAPPDVVQKLTAWANHQRGFMDKFSQDPIGAIKPGLEELVTQITQQAIQQHMGQYQEQVSARQILQQNAGWMQQTDAQGKPVLTPDGRPALSPLGQRYAHYVSKAQQLGLGTTQAQHEYAYGLVERDFYAHQQAVAQQTQTAGQQGQEAKTAFLQAAVNGATQPPAAGSGNSNGTPVPQAGSRGLAGRMTDAFRAAGFNLEAPLPG